MNHSTNLNDYRHYSLAMEYDECNRETLQWGFLEACVEGNTDKALFLLVSPDLYSHVSMAHDNYAGIKSAVQYGHLDILTFCLESPLLNNYPINLEQDYIFRVAAQYGHLHIIQYLVEHPTLSQKLDFASYAYDAFNKACSNGHLDIAQYLIEKLPQSVNINEQNGDCLRQACYNGHLHVVQYLLESNCGFDRQLVHYNNDICLSVAVQSNNLEIVSYIFEKFNCYGSIAKSLDNAVGTKNNDIIDYFILEKKVDKIPELKAILQQCQQKTLQHIEPLIASRNLFEELHTSLPIMSVAKKQSKI